jgi:hypothetical protein
MVHATCGASHPRSAVVLPNVRAALSARLADEERLDL